MPYDWQGALIQFLSKGQNSKKMQEFKYLVQEITIAAATTGLTSRTAKDITAGYERVVGIAFVEQSNGGNANYKIGFSDDNKNYIDPVPADLYKSGTNIKMDDRFLPVDIPGNGNKVYAEIVLPGVPASEFKVSIIYKLLKGAIARNC